MITKIRKRDGSVVVFDQNKITEAIWKAVRAVGGENKERAKEISEMVDEVDRTTLVITIVGDQGIDIPAVDSLIMGVAMKKYRRSIQRAGRGMRPKEGDNKVYIFDFMDNQNNVLRKHSYYRMETYQLEEYTFSNSLEETSERMKIPIQLETGLYQWDWVRGDKKKKSRYRRQLAR